MIQYGCLNAFQNQPLLSLLPCPTDCLFILERLFQDGSRGKQNQTKQQPQQKPQTNPLAPSWKLATMNTKYLPLARPGQKRKYWKEHFVMLQQNLFSNVQGVDFFVGKGTGSTTYAFTCELTVGRWNENKNVKYYSAIRKIQLQISQVNGWNWKQSSQLMYLGSRRTNVACILSCMLALNLQVHAIYLE